jgi:pilus assembly protein CpaC
MKAVPMRQTAIAGVACAVLASLAGAPAGVAQTRTAVSMGAAPQLINLPRGASFAVDLPADARDVIVSNPQVAEAMLHSPRRITVIGITPGETDAVFLDVAGRTILSLRVRVDAGTSALQDTLSRIAPGGQIHAEAVNDSVILTGFADNPAQAAQAARVAAAFVSAPEKVINMISVVGSDQVTLRVRVIEVQRNALKQLGFSSDILKGAGIHSYGFNRPNTYGVNGAPAGGSGLCYNQTGGRTTNVSNSNSTSQTVNSGNSAVNTTQTNVGDDLNFVRDTTTNSSGNTLSNTISGIVSTAFQTMTGTNASGCLEAFERVGLARTLAEPNLTSVNGESANFLAGGEFPLPTGRDREGNITVTYKPYGVGLAFRPVVMSGGRISLQVKVEVSELTAQGGFTIGAGTPSSITLPGLTVRRSENTVELPSGGSMMIAGLLQETTRQTVDSLPGVTNLPVLGSLFRSRDYLMGETELVVIVEPYIVSPTSPDRMQTPADGLRIASDSQTILFGQLNQVYGLPNAPPAGSVGYVIE